jgi:hypothetical protein
MIGHPGATVRAVCAASEPGQQQEILHQLTHPARLARDAGHHALEVVRSVRGSPLEQLGVGGDGGERRAQLVGGVGHELAHPPLRLAQLRFGGVPLAEGGFDPPEHDVEGARQAADLGVGLRPGDALVELARRDRTGRGLDRPKGPQTDTHQPPASGHGGRQRGRGHRQLNVEQASERALGALQRQRDDELGSAPRC